MDGSAERAFFVFGVSLHYADTFSQSGHFFGAARERLATGAALGRSAFQKRSPQSRSSPLALVGSFENAADFAAKFNFGCVYCRCAEGVAVPLVQPKLFWRKSVCRKCLSM